MQEIAEIDRHQDRQRDQKADQEFAAAAGIFGRIAVDHRVRPQMAADVGDEPEAVEAERDQLEARAARHQIKKAPAVARELSDAGSGGGTGTGGGFIGVQANSFTDRLQVASRADQTTD